MTAAVPFPFVVGVGRSGTTLLRTILNAHSDMAVAHESRFVAWTAERKSRYEKPGGFDVGRFLADVVDNPRASRAREWGLDAASIRAAVSEGLPTDLASAIRSVFRCYADANGKPRYGDKTPGYIRHLTTIAELLPEAAFVHLVRDGRDVALAMSEVDFGAENLAHAAYLWSERVRRAQQIGAALGAARYLLVRYEDLTDAPEREVERVCRFLGLEYQPAMVTYFERPDEVFSGLGSQTHHESLRQPITRGLRDWRRDMPARDVQQFEAVAGDVLTAIGYELSDSAAAARSAGARARTAVQILDGRVAAAVRARRKHFRLKP